MKNSPFLFAENSVHYHQDGINTLEKEFLIQLSLTPGIGPATVKQWLQEYGSAENLYTQLHRVKSQLKPETYFQLQQGKQRIEARDTHKIHSDLNIKSVVWNEHDYPPLLAQIPQSPITLYYKGSLDAFNNKLILAIVGTRKPSSHKISWLKEFIQDLKYLLGDGFVVVSGMAHGIDVEAHSTCLELGIKNYAVFAHGLEQVYPKNHSSIAQKIIEDAGGLITEHPAYTKMHPDLFPKRNRIIAGLCHATLVVESNIKGGSMVTASIASHFGRVVFAVPGRPQDLSNAGCNSLIQQNLASMCINAADFVQSIAPHLKPIQPTLPLTPSNSPQIRSVAKNLTDQQMRILDQMQQGMQQFDQLLLVTQLSSAQLSAELTHLEILGIIANEKHQHYSIC